MGIVCSGIGSGLYSEPYFPPDGNAWRWHETWDIQPEGFQDGQANVGNPFDELLMLRFPRRGVAIEIRFDLLYKGFHLARGNIDRRRHRVITLAHPE